MGHLLLEFIIIIAANGTATILMQCPDGRSGVVRSMASMPLRLWEGNGDEYDSNAGESRLKPEE